VIPHALGQAVRFAAGEGPQLWFVMDATIAILFTLYMVPVNLLDNILRPLVAKGLKTPMPVILIGVLGGTLVHGMIGLPSNGLTPIRVSGLSLWQADPIRSYPHER
jgi:hypothetical protein